MTSPDKLRAIAEAIAPIKAQLVPLVELRNDLIRDELSKGESCASIARRAGVNKSTVVRMK